MEPSGGRRIWRVSEDGVESASATLPAEAPLAIEIDGRQVAVLMRTPGDERALALGYCLSEGLIRSLGDVLLLHHCNTESDDALAPEGAPGTGHLIRLTLTPEAQGRLAPGQGVRWVFSGCGGVDASALGGELCVQSDLRLAPRVLSGLVPALARVQEAYRATGGIHAAGLFDANGQPLAIAEDVGRHNAVDKAIGTAALRGTLPHASILAATGRASSDIVAKAARVGIPVVASFSSSTSLAIELAERARVTVVGYLRRNRLTIYTHPERIATPI